MRSVLSADTKRRPRRMRFARGTIAWRDFVCERRKFCLSAGGISRWRVAILRARKTVCFFSQLSPLNPRSTACRRDKGLPRRPARVPRCLLINLDGCARRFRRARTSGNGAQVIAAPHEKALVERAFSRVFRRSQLFLHSVITSLGELTSWWNGGGRRSKLAPTAWNDRNRRVPGRILIGFCFSTRTWIFLRTTPRPSVRSLFLYFIFEVILSFYI